MTPYYQDDLVTIYHGDCQSMDLGELGGGVVVSDPPYGIGWQTAGLSRKRGATFDWPPITGDDRPFDPAPLLALGLPTVLFGANHYAERLPSQPSWLVWDKRVHMAANDQSDCELAWTNLGGPARAPGAEAAGGHALGDRAVPSRHHPRPLHGLRLHPRRRQVPRPPLHRHRDRGTLLRDRRPALLSGSAWLGVDTPS